MPAERDADIVSGDLLLLRGTRERKAGAIPLRSGPLSMVFEPDAALLRYVRLGEHEILRGVYAAVRDRDWGTVAPVVSNVRVENSGDAFRLAFDVRCEEREIDFFWTGEIVGTARGSVSFSMQGTARSTFLSNRIGFCVLHPITECKGRACVVEHADGTLEHGNFPRFISPHQPFKEMRAISHLVALGLRAEVRFEGDVFEMEDQRNWTDASYKTYCTPLERPFPVEVAEGASVGQSVALSLRGEIPATAASLPEASGVVFEVGEGPPVALPHIGLGAASHERPLSRSELELLRNLNLAHLRVDLRPAESDLSVALGRAAADARGLGVALEAAVFLSDAPEDELDRLVIELEKTGPRVARWLVFRERGTLAPEDLMRLVRARLGRVGREAAVGTGTDAFFAELNRECASEGFARGADLVCYPITPQVHASDDASLVETLQAQGETVESARQFAREVPVVVTPITLKPRSNPNATSAEPEPEPTGLPQQVDPRQASLFAAAWTLGCVKYLSESAVRAATFFETTGWRGVMGSDDEASALEVLRSLPGAVFPVYHVLADLGEFSGGEVTPSRSSDPLRVDGLALRKDGRRRVLLANMSPKAQTVRLEPTGSFGTSSRVRRLDGASAVRAMRSPEAFRSEEEAMMPSADGPLELVLSPYSVARVDWGGAT